MSSIVRSLVAVAITAAALYGMQHTTPGYGEITSPIAVAGKRGKRVAANAFTIGVANVHLARTVTTKRVGRTQTFTSSGVWVLVEGAAKTVRKPHPDVRPVARSNGVRYALSQRLSSVPGILPSERLEPGLPRGLC